MEPEDGVNGELGLPGLLEVRARFDVEDEDLAGEGILVIEGAGFDGSGPGTELPQLGDVGVLEGPVGLVESVREWLLDAPTLRRFALYLVIPLASWLGGWPPWPSARSRCP